MATVHFHGEPAHTIGDLPALGTTLPNFSLVDATGKIVYTQLVEEIGSEPDYEAAIAALK